MSVNPEPLLYTRQMKKFVSILFILIMCGSFLPAVLSYDQKKIVLFSAVEEEQPDGTKELKNSDETKAVSESYFYLLACTNTQSLYPNLLILFADDPCIGNHTPPPDSFC